ncbi:MAG: glycosyltransferase [Bacteroidota bacterium]
MTPHIVHTINGLRADHGGPSRSVGSLAAATAAHGATVEVVAGRSETDEIIRPEGVPVHLADRPGSRQIIRPLTSRFGCTLEDALGATSLIHDHGLWLPSNRISAAVARRHRVPRVVSVRGMVSPWALAQGAAKKRIAWTLYQKRDLSRAALLHATSDAEAGAIRALGLRVPIATIPNGVDFPPASSSPARAIDLRTALFLGRIHPVKGLLDLVHAWDRVRPPGWRLVMAGPDENSHQLEVELAIRDAGLDDAITLIGPIEDGAKWDLYRTADLFVLPSHSENFGIVVAEALACGVPVITTTGTPWSQLSTHACGWQVETGPDGLTGALSEAVGLPDDQRRNMGERGRQLVETQYAWTRAAEQMIEAYAWIFGHSSRPDFVTDGLA